MKSLEERIAEREQRREDAGLEPVEYPVVGVVLTSTEDKEVAAKTTEALNADAASGNGAGDTKPETAGAKVPAGVKVPAKTAATKTA